VQKKSPLWLKEISSAGLELYLESSLLSDMNQEAERVYLTDLQTALNLPYAVVALA